MYRHHNVVSDHPHIPEEAFLFIPYRSNDSKVSDDFKIGQGKNIRRLLFQGWSQQTITPYEVEKMQEFDAYLQRKNIKLDDRWDKSWRLRFLLSTGCNIKKCIADMESEIVIFHSYSVQIFSNCQSMQKEGVFYLSGRDSHYRPIMVFDVDKIIKLEMTEEEVLQTQTYFFQYVMRNYLIPGQVQNWVAIIDAAHIGLFSLIGSMKKSFTFLSDTFRSRMFVCYVVRIPTSLSFVWGFVKKFLEEQTVRKINFFDELIIEPLLQFCNPSQLQVKFGGSYQNIADGHFWPPKEISKNYKMEGGKTTGKYLTKQEYTQYYNKKILYNTKFHEENIIKPPVNKQLRDNLNLHLIKRLQKQFKIMLEMCSEDIFCLQQTVDPTSSDDQPQKTPRPQFKLQKPLNYLSLLSKNKKKVQTTSNK